MGPQGSSGESAAVLQQQPTPHKYNTYELHGVTRNFKQTVMTVSTGLIPANLDIEGDMGVYL
jgi:hypothetical protein